MRSGAFTAICQTAGGRVAIRDLALTGPPGPSGAGLSAAGDGILRSCWWGGQVYEAMYRWEIEYRNIEEGVYYWFCWDVVSERGCWVVWEDRNR